MRLDATRPFLLPGGEPSLKGDDETQHLLVQLAATNTASAQWKSDPPKIYTLGGGVWISVSGNFVSEMVIVYEV